MCILPRELEYKYVGQGSCIGANEQLLTRMSKKNVNDDACRVQCTQQWSCTGYQTPASSWPRCVLFGPNMVKEDGWAHAIEAGAGAISSTEPRGPGVCFQKLSPIKGTLSSMSSTCKMAVLSQSRTRTRARTNVLGGVSLLQR